MRTFRVLIPVLLISCMFACKREDPVYYPHAEINQIDDLLLFEAMEKAEQDGGIMSLIVYRNDAIIAEEYFGKGGTDSLHNVMSVTKSVTSILTGMAIEKGYITSIDETVDDYLSEYLRPEDSIVAGVTIRQLLTMTGGFDWNELTDPDWIYWNSWIRSEDHFLHALQLPIIHKPGSQFTYCTTGCQILSGIFTVASGYTLKEFAEEFLFAPLDIAGERPWDADHQGFNYGGVTLELKARDMMKIGQLYLDRGLYNGKRVVAEAWVDASTSPQVSTGNTMYFASYYGYYWWLGERAGTSYYFANGYGGQFICIFPALNLLVIAQSELNNAHHEPGEQWVNTLSLIMEDILPAVY